MPPKGSKNCIVTPLPQDSSPTPVEPIQQEQASKQALEQALQEPPASPTALASLIAPDILDIPALLEKIPDLPDEPDNPDDAPSLATAIMVMTQEFQCCKNLSSSCSISKVKELDTFNSSNPWKLNNFILLCNLYFRNNLSYHDNEPKVTFTLSFLHSTTLEYFKPTILESDKTLPWMDNWSNFVCTLCTQFGPINPTTDTEDGIDSLKMQDNQRIVKYNVKFTRLVIRTGWDDSVLCHCYYSGLAERIKDIMGQQGKPATLEVMKALTHSIDSHHFERLLKKSCY